MTVLLHHDGNARQAWFAIEEAFGLYGTPRTTAPLRIDDCFDDLEITKRCEWVERYLGITLELPLMLRTFGELAAYCTRQLTKQEGSRVEI